MANEKMMEEELDDVLILVDEENQEHPFQMIDMVEVDGNKYAVLVPLEEGSDEDEAIIQMELLGHQFYMYMDSETSKPAVVYKRNDGNYGLIESE